MLSDPGARTRWLGGGFALIAAVFYVLQIANGRFWMHDFEVYYGASRALLSGDPVYGPSFGLSTGLYKYAPAFLLLLAPVSALPFFAARTLHFFASAGAMVGALFVLERVLRRLLRGADARLDHGAVLLAFLVIGVHVYRELHLGNINLLLLLAVVLSLEWTLSGREGRAGALLGLVVLVKPHFAPLLPLLLLFHYWRTAAIAVGSLAGGLLAPALFVGFAKNLELHRQWGAMVRAHNAFLTEDGVNTLYAWGARLAPGLGESALVAGVAGAVGIAYLLWIRGADLRMAAYVFLALVPLLTLTDTEHFLLALPLVLLILLALRGPGRRPWMPAAALPLFVLYGGNWHDLVGDRLSDAMARSGILGLAQLGIVVLSVLLWQRASVPARSREDRGRAVVDREDPPGTDQRPS